MSRAWGSVFFLMKILYFCTTYLLIVKYVNLSGHLLFIPLCTALILAIY